MPWEDAGAGWASPHTYAQSDTPSTPGPSAYVDKNSGQDQEEASDDVEAVSSFLTDAILKRLESTGMGAVRGGACIRPALNNAFGLKADDTGDNAPREEDGKGDPHEKDPEECLVEFTFPSLSDQGSPHHHRTAESTLSTDSGSASPVVLTVLSSAGTEPEEELTHPAIPFTSELFAVSQIQTLQGSEDALPASLCRFRTVLCRSQPPIHSVVFFTYVSNKSSIFHTHFQILYYVYIIFFPSLPSRACGKVSYNWS